MQAQFAVDFGARQIAQVFVVLQLAVVAVGIGAALGEVGVDKAAPRRHAEQGDVAVVFREFRFAAAFRQHEVLHDKFHIDHAAARIFHIAFFRRMGGEHFFAHGDDFLFQPGFVARLHQNAAADVFEFCADFRIAANESGAGECLMFPRPSLFALVFFKGGQAVRQKAFFAVGAQAQVDVVQAACTGAAGEPCAQAARQFDVFVGRIGCIVFV